MERGASTLFIKYLTELGKVRTVKSFLAQGQQLYVPTETWQWLQQVIKVQSTYQPEIQTCQLVGELAPYSSAVVAESYPVSEELTDWPILLEMINLFKYCSLV